MEPAAKREAATALPQQLFSVRARITVADAVAAGQERGSSRRTLSGVGSLMGRQDCPQRPQPRDLEEGARSLPQFPGQED
jgi:hypothetical protein